MRFHRALLGFMFVIGSMNCPACAGVSNGKSLLLSGEQVLIVWNPKTKMEHFIRQASFKTEAPDFGFVVPTPTVPELSEADSTVFGALANYCAPPLNSFSLGGEGGSGGGRGGVTVLQVKEVGDYVATTVKAKDGESLADWLKENGFVSRPAVEEWCSYYADQKWVFTAFRYSKAALGPVNAQTVRLSFRTDKPRYPYKMPKDTTQADRRRPMTLYFVAPDEMAAHYTGTSREWRDVFRYATEFSGPIIREVAESIKLRVSAFPDNASVTLFTTANHTGGFDRDLEFSSVNDPLQSLFAASGRGG